MKKEKYAKKKNSVTTAKTGFVSEKMRNTVILGLIVVGTFFLFIQVRSFQFVNWDDNSYIQGNFLIRDISWVGLKNIFSTPVIGMYNPLPFVVYAIEYKFWGLDAGVYHLFNLIFHLLATIAAFMFIYELTKRYEAATIVALFFAIHPMHVSVVTWVSELKTSMEALFYFASLTCYIRYIRSSYQIKYLYYTGLLFLLALLSKPSAVTLAPMLCLLDYYLSRKIDRKLILEKIPFFAIALFFGILTIVTHVEAEDSIFESNNSYSLINNILVSNYSVVFYINKLFAPFNLCTIYPYPRNLPVMHFKYYFSMLIIPFIIWLLYRSKSFKKEMVFGLLYFIIAISVTLRIVPSGFFRASNVYTYMSYTGLFFIVAQFFIYIKDHRFQYAFKVKKYAMPLLVVIAVVYTWQSVIRIAIWENSITLFNDIIEKKPKLALAYNNRGLSKLDLGDVTGAMADLTKSIELDSNYAIARNNRGKILVDAKAYDAALKDLNMAIKLDTDYAEAYINRGNVMFNKQKYDEAMSDYNLAIRFNPNIEVAYKNRATIKSMRKNYADALKDLEKAIALNPDYEDAFIDKGNIMFNTGKYEEAIKNYNAALRINPSSKNAYNNRSVAEMVLKDTLDAREDAQKAAELATQNSAPPSTSLPGALAGTN